MFEQTLWPPSVGLVVSSRMLQHLAGKQPNNTYEQVLLNTL